MNDNFSFRAAAKTDAELHQCINDREKYLPETVEAALEELKSRGVAFTGEELRVIGEDMAARRAMAATKPAGYGFFSNRDQNHLIDDPDAPALYTRRAIYVFSFLFSTLFGSVLLAMNIGKTGKPGSAMWVVLYGICYTALVIVVAQALNLSSGFSIATSILGAYSLELLFWNRFIGDTTLYRARQVWVPAVIGVLLAGLVLFAIFNQPVK